jgi:hypothetical protein
MEQSIQPAPNKQAVAPRPGTSAEDRARVEDNIKMTGPKDGKTRLNRAKSAVRQGSLGLDWRDRCGSVDDRLRRRQ